MSEPFLGEIKICAFGFPPKGWALCNGQLLPINQNQALFALLGTMYGGDGRVNFALPDLRARLPLHVGDGFTQGQRGGEASHTLSLAELPVHTHTAMATDNPAAGDNATGAVLAQASLETYGALSGLSPMGPQTVTATGGSQPHPNLMPLLTLSFCIALQGIFPSRN